MIDPSIWRHRAEITVLHAIRDGRAKGLFERYDLLAHCIARCPFGRAPSKPVELLWAKVIAEMLPSPAPKRRPKGGE
jgi:hypothetical protein